MNRRAPSRQRLAALVACRGCGPYPGVDGGWAVEISLDVGTVSPTCPECGILLVEGNSSLVDDLAASVDTAASLGADVVSNSCGLSEFNGMQN
jgi:hypothetical protein